MKPLTALTAHNRETPLHFNNSEAPTSCNAAHHEAPCLDPFVLIDATHLAHNALCCCWHTH
jgi:hypothetical protein